jgi:SpoVK/Ycf46/Vps4 family AAA+-type ATPase
MPANPRGFALRPPPARRKVAFRSLDLQRRDGEREVVKVDSQVSGWRQAQGHFWTGQLLVLWTSQESAWRQSSGLAQTNRPADEGRNLRVSGLFSACFKIGHFQEDLRLSIDLRNVASGLIL